MPWYNPRPLEGEECSRCREESVVWGKNDETEDTIEVLVECKSCYRANKRFVGKDKDTSDSALEQVARNIC